MADRIVASAETIRKAVARVAKAYMRKNIIPILGCAMLAYEDGTASLTTTDLDKQITSSFDAEVEGIGRVAIPFYALRWIAGMIGDVTFEIIEPKDKTPPKLVASDTSGAKLSTTLSSIQLEPDTKPFTIGFNGRYIREGVKAIGGVGRFEVVNPREPVKVRGEDPSMLLILMPRRV